MILTGKLKLEARIAELEEDLNQKSVELSAVMNDFESLKAQLETANEEKESIQDQLNEANQKINDAEKANEDKISDLEDQIETIKTGIDKQVATKAAAIVAELGIAPVGVKSGDKPNTPDVSNLKGLDRVIAALKQKNAQS